MKRLTLLLLGLALGVTATASAQGLTMQMSNGWSFSFAGNVNAFWVFSQTLPRHPRTRAYAQGCSQRSPRSRPGARNPE